MLNLLESLLLAWGHGAGSLVEALLRLAAVNVSPVTIKLLAGAVALLVAGLFLAVALRLIDRGLRQEGRPAMRALLTSARPVVTAAVWVVALALAAAPPLSLAREQAWAPSGLWAAAVALAVALGLCATWLLMRVAGRLHEMLIGWTSRTESPFDDLLVQLAARIAQGLIPALAIYAGVTLLADHPAAQAAADRALAIVVIGALAWVLFQVVGMLDSFLMAKYRIDAADNLAARRVFTQAMVIKKIAYFLIVLLSLASVLMQFDAVRQLGASLLASAGLASLIIGLAAQKTIGNLLAGVQIAITQPIRIDDVVIVEGEWGRIEEINLTYVVVAIWDQRRLIVPISHFIEKPFQNWTRKTAEILGTVFLYTDYTVPVDAMRSELNRLVTNDPNWDRRLAMIQVTDCKERTVEVRVLVSSADAGKAWDLRCAVREGLVAWLQREHPAALPRLRTQTPDLPA